MDNGSFLALIGLVCTIGISVWLQLLMIDMGVKPRLLQCQMWTVKAFPKTIWDIENNLSWRTIVGAFYTGRVETKQSCILYVISLILLIVVPVFIVSVQHETLKVKVIDYGITQLHVWQVIIFVITVAWLICIVFSFYTARSNIYQVERHLSQNRLKP